MKRHYLVFVLSSIAIQLFAQSDTMILNGHGEGLTLTNSADNAGTYINFQDHDGKRANIVSFDDNYHTATYRNALLIFARHGKDIRLSTSSDGNVGTNKLTILNDGKIGIGTDNPFKNSL